MNYIIIGDIHGMLEPLEALLLKLGFSKRRGTFWHSDYKVIFLGDLVDRGKHQRAVLELARGMVDDDAARVIMGNHEYNLLGFHTRNPENGEYLLARTDRRFKHHGAFLKDYGLDTPESQDILNWLKQRPLCLEFDHFRVVHAQWDQAKVDYLKPLLLPDYRMTVEQHIQSYLPNQDFFYAIKVLLKGSMVKLPNEWYFHDSGGNRRDRSRIQWWNTPVKHWSDFVMKGDAAYFPDAEIPKNFEQPTYAEDALPVFFGHYWFTDKPCVLRRNAACLDYSACRNGQLVAYRWHEEDQPHLKGLRDDRFVAVPGQDFLLQ